MEVRLLAKGYKNNEQFYQDFLNDRINSNDEYFSDEVVYIKKAPDFPIYMGRGSDEYRKEGFLKAFRIIGETYLNTERDLLLDETFWHSLLVTHKREYILNYYPEVEDSINKFHNVVLKGFNWENYIYKCILGAQYVNDNFDDEAEQERYYELITDNLDVYNYIIKYEIFRNDQFLIKILDIIDELNLSKIMKANIKGREDLGADERYGRRVIFEFNKSYPIVMAPMLEKEELKKIFIMYLGYYYDLDGIIPKKEVSITQESKNRVAQPVISTGDSHSQNRMNKYNIEKQRVAETKFSEEVKEGQPKKDKQDDLLAYMEKHHLEYVDHRAKGGSLWVMGDKRIEPFLKPWEHEGIRFKFKPVGGRASKGRPAWYLL